MIKETIEWNNGQVHPIDRTGLSLYPLKSFSLEYCFDSYVNNEKKN